MRLYLLFLALPLFAQNAAQPPLTLAEAEALAIKNNPDVAGALLNAAAANQVTLTVRAAALPTAYASLTAAGAVTGSRLAAGDINNPTVFNRVASGLTASQLITDFGRTSQLTASARLRANARVESARATRAQVLLQVDRAYFAALRANSVLGVARQAVNTRQTVTDQIEALAKVQLKSGLDVSFANVNLSEAKLLLVNAESDVNAAQAELSAALGFTAQQTFQLVDPPQIGAPPADLNELIRGSLQDRPELRSLRSDRAAAEQFAKAEQSLRNPDISALGAVGYVPLRDQNIRSRYAAAGVNVNIPIFNGHLFAARAAEAELRFQEAQQQVKGLETRISRDVRISYLNSAAAYRRLALTDELAAQAAQGLELAQARYDLGLSSIVELTQAQLSKTSADIATATARYDYELQRSVLNYQTAQ